MRALVTWILALALAACSGKAIVDGSGSGGAGGTGAGPGPGPGTTTTTTGPITTGTITCMRHEDCPGGTVCIFGTGTCAPSCQQSSCDSCGPGSLCNDCATSSCPSCDDCMAACLPIADGGCDDDDKCKEGTVCVFPLHQCAAPCTADGGCNDPGLVCAPCVTGSCCGCEDCVDACIMSI